MQEEVEVEDVEAMERTLLQFPILPGGVGSLRCQSNSLALSPRYCTGNVEDKFPPEQQPSSDFISLRTFILKAITHENVRSFCIFFLFLLSSLSMWLSTRRATGRERERERRDSPPYIHTRTRSHEIEEYMDGIVILVVMNYYRTSTTTSTTITISVENATMKSGTFGWNLRDLEFISLI